LPFMFKQVTAPRSGFVYNALDGKDWHEFPAAPNGLEWAPRQTIPEKYALSMKQIGEYKNGSLYPFHTEVVNLQVSTLSATRYTRKT